MISELRDEQQSLIERLPVYADNDKRFVPGYDPCFAVYGEVVWADGAFGLTAYGIEEISLVWDDKQNRWEPSMRQSRDKCFALKFYSTHDAAEKARDIMEKAL